MQEDVCMFHNAPLTFSANWTYCANWETINIVWVLIILTTHEISRRILHTKKPAVLLLFNVFYYYKCVVFCMYHTLVLLR